MAPVEVDAACGKMHAGSPDGHVAIGLDRASQHDGVARGIGLRHFVELNAEGGALIFFYPHIVAGRFAQATHFEAKVAQEGGLRQTELATKSPHFIEEFLLFRHFFSVVVEKSYFELPLCGGTH